MKKINLKRIALIICAVLSGICSLVSFCWMIVLFSPEIENPEIESLIESLDSLGSSILVLLEVVLIFIMCSIMCFFAGLSISLFFSCFKINDKRPTKRPTSREEALIIAHGERSEEELSTVEVGIFSSKVSGDYYLKIIKNNNKKSSYNNCEPGFDKISKSHIPLGRNYFKNHTMNDLISLIKENVNTALEFNKIPLISLFEKDWYFPSSEKLSCFEEARKISDYMFGIEIYIAREMRTVNTRKRHHGIENYYFTLRVIEKVMGGRREYDGEEVLSEEVIDIDDSFFKSYDKLSNFIYSAVRDRLYYRVDYLALNEAALMYSLKDAEFYLSLNKKRKENAK